MKPAIVAGCVVGVMGSMLALSVYGAQRRVKLAVYEKPVTFFSEERQTLQVGNLPRGVNSLSAAACSDCHQAEHAEWQASAHARSVTEPVFAAAFEAEPRFLCRSCHSPLQEQHPILAHRMDKAPTVLIQGEILPSGHPSLGRNFAGTRFIREPNRRYDAALAREGVTCVTCHVREGTVLTSRPTGSARVPHALSYSPMLSKSEFCAGCHQFQIANPQAHPMEREPVVAALGGHRRPAVRLAQHAPPGGEASTEQAEALPFPEEPPVPPRPDLELQYQQEARVQNTLDEFRISPAAARGESCQSCHMPSRREGHGHLWAGRNDLGKLREAVQLSARLDRETYSPGEKLQAVIKLKNEAGHRFPTGDGLHAGILDVWLVNGKKTLGRQVFVMSDQGNGPGAALQQFAPAAARDALLRQAELAQAERTLALTRRQAFLAAQGPPPSSKDGSRLDAPRRDDTRLLPGEEATLVYTQPVSAEMERAEALVLKVRVYHGAVHPGLRGTRTAPKGSPLTLIREEILPVKVLRREANDGHGGASRASGPRE